MHTTLAVEQSTAAPSSEHSELSGGRVSVHGSVGASPDVQLL